MLGWVKWEKGLTRKAKLLRIAADLGVTPHEAAGICMEFWEWADDNSVDGYVDVPVDAVASTMASLTSRRGVVEALKKVGWIITDDTGIIIPKFEKHNGNSAKKRAQKAQRQAKWRKNM